jgi:glycosyltransferase involved in cell wall biosynthesis
MSRSSTGQNDFATMSEPFDQNPRPPTIGVVVPCYNEQAVLPETLRRLDAMLRDLVASGSVGPNSRVWLVDDGSRDRTWEIIEAAARLPEARICGIKLSRNRGHQVALLAGLMSARGDALISVDADLQDDLNAIPKMVQAFAAGHDIVYGVRSGRTSDSVFKRVTAQAYYRLLRRLGVEIVVDHADFRLLSRRAVEALRAFPETNVFLRGLVPQLGFPSAVVAYERAERFAGESKYPVRKMLALAWQGVTSFSAVPLRAITSLGLIVSLASLAMGLWALWVRFFTPQAVPGWASIVIPLFFISGVQLLSLGIIGEYVAKIFIETKRRPLHFVDRVVGEVTPQPRPGDPA